MSEVRRMTTGANDVQKKLRRVKASATSEDGLITATVGPRGQLVELTIDAKIYRRPDSARLAQVIMKTIRDAVEQTLEEQRKLIEEIAPKEFMEGKGGKGASGTLAQADMLRKHDAELLKQGEPDDVE